MELTRHAIAYMAQWNPGDIAIYQVDDTALRVLYHSPNLAALSGMTLAQDDAIIELYLPQLDRWLLPDYHTIDWYGHAAVCAVDPCAAPSACPLCSHHHDDRRRLHRAYP